MQTKTNKSPNLFAPMLAKQGSSGVLDTELDFCSILTCAIRVTSLTSESRFPIENLEKLRNKHFIVFVLSGPFCAVNLWR